MQAVEREAQNQGYSQMHLSVHPTNLTATNFYLNNGWKKDCPNLVFGQEEWSK
jgi:ribosomal protein S18 acetylase RimI-like enzyme